MYSEEENMDEFDLEGWLLNTELEEDKNDPHFSIYYTPLYYEEEVCQKLR